MREAKWLPQAPQGAPLPYSKMAAPPPPLPSRTHMRFDEVPTQRADPARSLPSTRASEAGVGLGGLPRRLTPFREEPPGRERGEGQRDRGWPPRGLSRFSEAASHFCGVGTPAGDPELSVSACGSCWSRVGTATTLRVPGRAPPLRWGVRRHGSVRDSCRGLGGLPPARGWAVFRGSVDFVLRDAPSVGLWSFSLSLRSASSHVAAILTHRQAGRDRSAPGVAFPAGCFTVCFQIRFM